MSTTLGCCHVDAALQGVLLLTNMIMDPGDAEPMLVAAPFSIDRLSLYYFVDTCCRVIDSVTETIHRPLRMFCLRCAY